MDIIAPLEKQVRQPVLRAATKSRGWALSCGHLELAGAQVASILPTSAACAPQRHCQSLRLHPQHLP